MGPYAVTADEVDDAPLTVECRVNGELRQTGQHRRPHLRRPDPDRDDFRRTHAAAGRHHRDRYAGRRRDRLRSAAISCARGDLVEVSIITARHVAQHASPDQLPLSASTPRTSHDSSATARTSSSRPPARARRCVFVHGLGGTTNFYEPQAAALAASHQVSASTCPAPAVRPSPGPARSSLLPRTSRR